MRAIQCNKCEQLIHEKYHAGANTFEYELQFGDDCENEVIITRIEFDGSDIDLCHKCLGELLLKYEDK